MAGRGVGGGAAAGAADLNTAYRNFFASVTGKRKGRKVAPPRFRSRKDNRQAIRFTTNARFKVARQRRAAAAEDRRRARCAGRGRCRPTPSSVTVIRDAAGRYFASFVVRDRPGRDAADGRLRGRHRPGADALRGPVRRHEGRPRRSSCAGPARKLKRLQQALSRKQKGSSNRKKAVVKVARAHARVADARRDWQHKLSTAIIRDNQAVYVEDLCGAVSAGPGWRSPCTTPAGRRSPACWSTRPPGTGAPSPGSTGSADLPDVLGVRPDQTARSR